MYFMPDAVHYLAVGLSACRCITKSLQHLGINSINNVLYLPSGYGRELRFAQLLLPHSTIIASDIDRTGLNFCHKEFGVKTVLSNDSFSVPHLDGQFDLIWCGSLITHLNEASAVRLLELFYSLLAPGGLCLFSTHGTMHAHWIEKRSQTYGLSEAGQRDLLKQFGDGGYGYANYLGLRNYGISVVSYSKMVSLAKTVGTWSEVIYLERGWHNSHDVFGFSNRDLNNRSGATEPLIRFAKEPGPVKPTPASDPVGARIAAALDGGIGGAYLPFPLAVASTLAKFL